MRGLPRRRPETRRVLRLRRSTRRLRAPIRVALTAIGLLSGGGPVAGSELEDEAHDLRELLTEREDENTVADPLTFDVFGHPLALYGELSTEFEGRQQVDRQDPPDEDDRVLSTWELGGEAFYTLGPPLSIFLQGQLVYEADLLGRTRRATSDVYLERDEMWVYSQHVFGSPVDFELGRLDFEDDRTFWYDGSLDALRLTIEGESAELQLSVARELFPVRSDEWRIEAESKDVLRLIGELSWDYAEAHGVQLFAIHERDDSGADPVGAFDDVEREDDSDARLTWLGARATGVFQHARIGLLGYWIDAAFVVGSERVIGYGDEIGGRVPIEERFRRDVRGFAVDVGATWAPTLPGRPRLTLGYAYGSGDRDSGGGSTASFRQTRLQGNQPGFGGVQRFARFGRLLDPELSNLRIATVGLGIAFLRESSFDLVYHHYRLDEPVDELRDAALATRLNARDRALGDAFDAVLAIEEGDRFELELSFSGFRSGAAFGARRGEWVLGGFAALRIAF